MWCGRRRSVASLLGCWRSCWRSRSLPWGVRAAGGGALRALSRASVCRCHGARAGALVASGGLWWGARASLVCLSVGAPLASLVGFGGLCRRLLAWLAAGVGRRGRCPGRGVSVYYLLTYLLLERGRAAAVGWSAVALLSAAAAVGCRLSIGRARSIDPRGRGRLGSAPRGCCSWPAAGRAVQVAGVSLAVMRFSLCSSLID